MHRSARQTRLDRHTSANEPQLTALDKDFFDELSRRTLNKSIGAQASAQAGDFAPKPCTIDGVTLTLERKKTDFGSGSAVTAYTGSGCCCCCCCLHWVGAAIGGGVGMRKGWTGHFERTPRLLHYKARKRLLTAMVVGFLLNLLPLFVIPFDHSVDSALAKLLVSFGFGTMITFALAPLLVFLPPTLGALISALLLRRRLTRAYLAERAKPAPTLPSEGDVYRHPTEHRDTVARDLATLEDFELCCNQCWTPIGEGVFVSRCPSCDAPIDRPMFRQANDAVALAQRVFWTSMLGAFAGTAGGYLVMSLFLIGK